MNRMLGIAVWTVAVLLAAGGLAAETPSTLPADPKMSRPQKLPGAGLSIALPVGFETLPLSEPNEALAALRIEGRKATQSLTLAIHTVGVGDSPETFESALVDQSRHELAVRHFQADGQRPCRAAGLAGVQQAMQYVHRGTPTSAIRACLARDLPATDATPARRLMIVLSVETAREHAALLPATFRAVLDSLKTEPIVSPINQPIALSKNWLKDYRGGCGIRQPESWTGQSGARRIVTFAQDNTRGGIENPELHVVSLDISGAPTAKQLGDRAIAFEKKQGARLLVLQERASTLDGKPAWEYLLQRTIHDPMEKTPDRVDIEVRRLLCVPEEDRKQTRHYALLLRLQGGHPRLAQTMMATLADSFRLIERVKQPDAKEGQEK